VQSLRRVELPVFFFLGIEIFLVRRRERGEKPFPPSLPKDSLPFPVMLILLSGQTIRPAKDANQSDIVQQGKQERQFQ